MTIEQATPRQSQSAEELYYVLQQSMESHTADEPHEIEHEDLEHFGQCLSDLAQLPLRRS